MERLTVVCDASPIIALAQVDLLNLLRPLFEDCVIPPVVAREIAPSVRRPDWIRVLEITRPLDPRVVRARLDPGETEAIGLALELGGISVVLDDRPARRLARELALPLLGTFGLLVAAKRIGLLAEVRPHMDALLAKRFRASPQIVALTLELAGEGPPS